MDHPEYRQRNQYLALWSTISVSEDRTVIPPPTGSVSIVSITATSHAQQTSPASDRSPYIGSVSKRSLDIAVAGFALLSLLPLLGLVAGLIRLTSKGPIFFRQTRCGIGGRPFKILKFRSMYTSEEPTSGFVVQAVRDDARITPIGRFIRRTSIDELPQLLNVLMGHMTLIGPRPHAQSHDVYFGAHIARYSNRFVTRPGLTGLAQISGARGATPNLTDMERRIELDLAYIRSATLTSDLRILVLTAREMLFSKSAY